MQNQALNLELVSLTHFGFSVVLQNLCKGVWTCVQSGVHTGECWY